MHFKAECQPGYRGSRCKATARLLPCKIPASEQKKEQPSLFLFWWRCGDLPYSDCYRRSIACSRRGSHGDAVLRFFKIAINPRIDDIEKQVEQEVQLVSRLVEMRGLPYSDCYRRSIACSRRGSRCRATARLLPCKIPALTT